MIHNCSISGDDVGKFNTENTDLNTSCTISHQEAQEEVDRQPQYDPHPASLPSSVIEWKYIERSSGNNHHFPLSIVSLLIFSILQMWNFNNLRDLSDWIVKKYISAINPNTNLNNLIISRIYWEQLNIQTGLN